ncbi:hypothetical protein LOD99_3231 [Oopsacas minuta]|uniref:AAA+ ATPase domain-containing protein n=1 Tax=Oopsacas minuta TaxID=111878 RepID=A0AAV7JXX1_9METZ|nr:hypothetical protein LOD99_3231 [Oopsacas minuta]
MAENVEMFENPGMTAEGSAPYEMKNALHITGMFNVSETFVFSVNCFSKLSHGILEQQLILADDYDADVTQLRILLINCKSDKLAQQLEQATHKSTIKTIVILYATEEHVATARGYIDRFNFPLLFVEEKCDKIIELFNRFPELKAEVSIKDYKEVFSKTIYQVRRQPIEDDSREPFQLVSERLHTESMKPRSMLENPNLFIDILKIIRNAKEDDNQGLKKQKRVRRIYDDGFSHYLKYSEAKTDFLYYIVFIREIFSTESAKVSEAVTPLLLAVSAQQVQPKELKGIFNSFFTTCNSPTAIYGCDSLPKKMLDFLRADKLSSFKQVKEAKDLADKLFWSNLYMLMEEEFESAYATGHFSNCYWSNFFTQKCKVPINEDSGPTFYVLSEGIIMGKEMGIRPERCIQPSHYILLIKKEKNLKIICLALEKLFTISCYNEGHSFMIKFKEFFTSLDDSRSDLFIKDPEYTNNACRLMSFLADVVYKSKELATPEENKRVDQLEAMWSDIYKDIVVMWAFPFYTTNMNIPTSYPDDLLQFKIGLKIPPASGLLRKWTYSYINPTLANIINRTKQYSPEVFYSIITKFTFLTKDFMMSYLGYYTQRKDVSLRSNIWVQIFNMAFTVSTKYEDSTKVFDSILICLQKIFRQYVINQSIRSKQLTYTGVIHFILDLFAMKLDCKPTYFPDKISQTEPWKGLKMGFNRYATQIQNSLERILGALPTRGESTILQEWFMMMIMDAATPIHNEIMSPIPLITTTKVFKAATNAIQEWFTVYEIQDLTPKYCYAWVIMAACCKNTSGIKHLQLHNMPLFIVYLLEIYNNTHQIASTYVEVSSIQTVDREFSIVREHLQSAAYDIQKNNVTFTLLFEYLKNQDAICKLYKMAGLGEVFTKEELGKLNTLYNQVNTTLSRKLILQLPKKAYPPSQWKLLKDSLEHFGVEVVPLIMIHKNFKIIQMENSEYPCCVEPMPDIKINEYGELTNSILAFLKPLEQYEDFFTHFFLQKNDLFMASLSYFCQRERTGTARLSIESFASAVTQTYIWLENVIQEKSTFADIRPIFELLDLQVLNVDLIKSQFRKFPRFSSLTRDLNFMDMFELLQYRAHLPAIKRVCDAYSLTRFTDSHEYRKINQYSEKLQDDKLVDVLTIETASTYLNDLRRCLSGTSPRRLRIFEVMLSAKEFYNFLVDPENEYYKTERRKLFFDEIEIITGDLQNQDYNDKILSHLQIAYNFIIPFCFKDLSFPKLMQRIASEEYKNGEESGFEQLETVNRNIQQIRLWFIISRGEAAQNDSQQLTDILLNGTFEIQINEMTLHQGMESPFSLADPSKGIPLSEDAPVTDTFNYPIVLKYGQSTKKRRQSSVTSQSSISPFNSLKSHHTLINKLMNQDMIDEFVRKLGFLEFDNNDSLREKTHKFGAFYSEILKLSKILTQLHYYGHPDFVKRTEVYPLTKDISELKMVINNYELLFYNWKQGIDERHKTYPLLSHFTMQRVSSIIRNLNIEEWDEAAQLLAFVFNRIEGLHSKLANWLSTNYATLDTNLSLAEHLGQLLNMMRNNSELTAYVCTEQSLFCESIVEKPCLHNIHKYYNVSDLEIMSLLISLYSEKPFHIPHYTEILHCTPSMGDEEIELFLKRTEQFPEFIYSLIKVNLLPTNLQEKIVTHMSQQKIMAQTHYIETGPSVLGELSTVRIHTYGIESEIEDRGSQCLTYLNNKKICQVTLVYGLEGVGKTHYIKNKIRCAREKEDIDVVQVAIHEGFSLSSVIEKIKSQFNVNNLKHGNILYFNFTIACPSSDKKDKKFQELMSSICWFFFYILILGYVYDEASGKGFYMPVGLNWQVYVEVPIQATNLEDTKAQARVPESYLENFLNLVPILKFIGKKKLIQANKPYQINHEVQLVCKYLRAMEEFRSRKGKNSQIGINTLYQEGSGSPVKFGNKPTVPDAECYTLLNKYMATDVQSKKILQKLYIKYMYRRCLILETMPPFNFNTGSTVLMEVDGKTKQVCLKNLGSTLMELMLNEVNVTFCSLISSREWSSLDHHQLVYDSVGGAYSIFYLSLNPEKLPPVITTALDTIGVSIPQREQLGDRDTLDPYLARALGIRIPGDGKRLSLIDNEGYVLTSDFVMKMININERRMCGVPVIIEGETGVGKTELMRILAFLWKIPYEINIERWKSIFHESLNDILADEDEKYVGELFSIVEKVGLSCTEFSKVDLLKDSDKLELMIQRFFARVMKSLEELVRLPAFYLLDLDWNSIEKLINKILHNKCTIDDSSYLSTFLCRLLKAPFIMTFYKYNMHSAITQENIKLYFEEVISSATNIYNRCTNISNQFQTSNMHIPTITVFIDEINTSSCLGLFKEITIDNSIDGSPLPSNLFVIAASNPHRSVSAPIYNQSKERDWVLGWYHVNQLHPTMELLKWNFGALNEVQENEYISTLMAITAARYESKQDRCYSFSQVSPKDLKLLSTFIHTGQSKVRDFARDTLLNIFDKRERKTKQDKEREEKILSETISRSKSSVSQRDIKRVFTLIEFIGSIIDIPPSEMKETGIDHYKLCRRIILVAVGVVYYLRLDHEFRRQFKTAINIDGFEKFESIFEYEVDQFVNKADIPNGIAKTQGLKENLFATIICTITKIPLIIVGPPGTSKTLSFNLTVSNLNKAKESKSYYFQQSNFPSLDAQYYQCSRKSTSKEIENVFKRALKRQEANDDAGLPVNCVVFLDEAGLPEEQQDSLKVLHYFLDAPKVSFVAISNHILDAAKSNRAINVFRPYQNDPNDLEQLAKGCFYQDENTSKVTEELQIKLKQFCNAYVKIETRLQEIERFDFFGMRDFIHFLNYLNRHSTIHTGITEMMVVRALERNFSGIDSKAFLEILTHFAPDQEESELKYLLRNTVDVLHCSLKDKSVRPLKKGSGKLVEVRFKLIIDASEDDTVIRLLFRHNILDSRSRHFVCTDFLEDDEMQKVNLVSAIQNAASQGLTVIMSHGEDIFECFYDVFNQNYKEINDVKTGVRYYANIAIGSHTKPCRIHPDFQCIVHMHKSEIATAPAPFLNRFEKFLITQEDIKKATLDAIPKSMNKLVNCAIEKIQQFLSNLAPKNFYSKIQDTVNSLLIELLPPPPRDNPPDVIPNERIRIHQALSKQESCSDAFNTEPYIYLDLLIDHLREKYHFHIIHLSLDERNTIAIDILEYALTQVPDAVKEYYLIKADPSSIMKWVPHAIELLYTVDDPNAEFIDTGKRKFDAKLVVNFGELLVASMILQFIIRYVCCQLLKVTIPETITINKNFIDPAYRKHYLYYQNHFSLKNLIASHIQLLEEVHWDLRLRPTKLICFTTTNSFLHKLPDLFPSEHVCNVTTNEKDTINNIRSCIFERAERVCLFSLRYFPTREHFVRELKSFLDSDKLTVMVLIVNVQLVSTRKINFVRHMIEQEERLSKKSRKFFVLVLHYSPGIFHSQGFNSSLGDENQNTSRYPSHFVLGWDHYYIESISPPGNIVNIQTWLKLTIDNDEVNVDWKHDFVKQLKESLIGSILFEITSFVSFRAKKIDSRLTINSDSTSITRRNHYLKKIFECTDIDFILCEKFVHYWTPKAIQERLVIASSAVISRGSNLNISDYVQTNIRYLFSQYIIEMIYRINDDLNLDTLFQETNLIAQAVDDDNQDDVDTPAVKYSFEHAYPETEGDNNMIIPDINKQNCQLFERILIDYNNLPSLEDLQLVNRNKDMKVSIPCWSREFPFSKYISELMEELIEMSLLEIAPSTLDTPRGAIPEKKQEIDSPLQDRVKHCLISKLNKIETTGMYHEVKYPIVSIALEAFHDDESWVRYKTDYIISRLELHADMAKFLAEFARLWGNKFNLEGQTVIERVTSFHVENYFNPPDSSRQLYLVLNLQKTIDVDLNITIESAHADFSAYILSTFHKLLSTCGDDIQKWKEWTLNYECLSSQKNICVDHLTPPCKALYLKLHFIYLNNSCDRLNWSFVPNAITLLKEYKNLPLKEGSDLPSFMSHLQSFITGTTGRTVHHEFVSKFMDHYIDVCSPLSADDCNYLCKFILDVFGPPTGEFYHILSFQHLEHLLVRLLHSLPFETNDNEQSVLPFNSFLKQQVGYSILEGPLMRDDSTSVPILLIESSYFPPNKNIDTAPTHLTQSLDAFIPPYYYSSKNYFIEQAHKNVASHMRSDMSHLYFSVCMNEIERVMHGHGFEHMMRQHENFAIEGGIADLEVIAQIEKQALFQVILKKFASFYNLNQLLNPAGLEQYQQNFPDVIKAFHKELLNADSGGGKKGGHSWVLLSWIYINYSNSEDCTECLKDLLQRPIHGWLKDFESKMVNYLNQDTGYPWITDSYKSISKILKDITSRSMAVSTKISENPSISKLNDLRNFLVRECSHSGNQVIMTLWYAVFVQFYCENKSIILDEEIARSFPHLCQSKQKFIRCFANSTTKVHNQNFIPIRNFLTHPSCLQKSIFYFIEYFLTSPEDTCFYNTLIFDPHSIVYLPGSLTLKKLGEDPTARIDLICCLNEEGLYSSDSFLLNTSTERNSFSLQSFYLINMLNYISLLLSYLIHDILHHPDVQCKLFSEKYCRDLVMNLIGDIRKCWSLLIEVSGVYEEDMVSVIRHFFKKTLMTDSAMEPVNLLLDLKDIVRFERQIHYRFHKFSLNHIKLASIRNPDLAHNLWTLNTRIPKPITAKSILAYIEPKNTEQLNNHDVILAFISLRKPLRVGAMLLPIALKLYEMFHVDLNYVLLKEMAISKSLTNFVREVCNRHPSLIELKELVKNFENYLPEYVALRKPNLDLGGELPKPLRMYDVLNVEEKGRDTNNPPLNILLTIIKDIIKLHNGLIDLVNKCTSKILGYSSETAPSILPTQDSAISNMITDLTQSELVQFRHDSFTCCRGDPPLTLTEDKLEVSKFYRRRAPDSFIVIKEIQGGFNLDGLERDLIMAYISPKFKFEDPIEKEYHFRIPHPIAQSSSQYYKIDVFNDLLTQPFKALLPENLIRDLEYHFHMLDYNNVLILLKGLQTVTSFLIQSQNITPGDKQWAEFTLGMYAKHIMNQDSLQGAFSQFEFNKLSKSQSTILAELQIIHLFECFKFFYDKLSLKYYEFCHLTYSVKKPLPPKVERKLEFDVQQCLDNRVGHFENIEPLRIFLDDLQVKLQYKESFIIQNPKSSMEEILNHVHPHDITHRSLINLLNQEVTNEHYVHLILKIKSIVSQLKAKHPKLQKWEENVVDFWNIHLPYFCEHNEDDSIDMSGNILYHYNLDFFDTEISYYDLLQRLEAPSRHPSGILRDQENVYDIIPKEAKMYI